MLAENFIHPIYECYIFIPYVSIKKICPHEIDCLYQSPHNKQTHKMLMQSLLYDYIVYYPETQTKNIRYSYCCRNGQFDKKYFGNIISSIHGHKVTISFMQ